METGEYCYLAKRISENNATVSEYAEPVAFMIQPNYLTVSSASMRGYMAVAPYGEKLTESWTLIAKKYAFRDTFKVGDCMWLDGKAPDLSDINDTRYASSANAEIIGATIIGNDINVFLRKHQSAI